MIARRLCRARSAAAALALIAALVTAPAAVIGQTVTQPAPAPAATPADAPGAQTAPDYVSWEIAAEIAESAVSDPDTASASLEAIRARMVERRQEFEAAQNINSARIATLREQVDALGAPPAEGQTEAPEIADRRAALTTQLDQLQVPGLTASEAFRRADGIIREIDRILRDRQTSELVKLWPLPINPVNWPVAVEAVTENWVRVRDEVMTAAAQSQRIVTLRSRLPVIIVLLVIGLLLILRARPLMDRVLARLPEFLGPKWVKVWSVPLSAAQLLLPVTGLLLILAAALNTGMLGVLGSTAASSLVTVGFLVVLANWLGRWLFPRNDAVISTLQLGPRQRREGRYLATTMGLLVGLEYLRDAMITATGSNEAAASVLAFPLLVLAGLSLVLMGRLLRSHVAHEESKDAARSFQQRLIGLLGRAAMIIGVVGPLAAAVGYVPAALALVFPAIVSLGILALLYILQNLIEDAYNLLTGRAPDDTGALFPVLIGFVLALAALPVLALVWGARVEQLSELWETFRKGFSIGETQISPSSFLVFGVVFALGYMVTRLLQATLRTSVLPRTRLDIGGQNAIVAGIGYIGIFLAGLIAINSAGINLAGLAIVAGALSVGIGFGLQNIVQNFVSGIILLVERPISEGDWIEVAGVQGTVQTISVRSTRIRTFDRSDVIVPNADLVSGQVTNFTRFNLSGRLIVPVSVAYDSDSRKVERLLREIAEAEPLALVNPAPLILFNGFGADGMNFEVRMILSDVNFSLSVRSEMNHEILRRFREAGIEIPFPQREVWLHGSDGGAASGPPREQPRARGARAALQRDEALLQPDMSDTDGEAGNR